MSSSEGKKNKIAKIKVKLPDADMSQPIVGGILSRLGHKAAAAKEIEINKLKKQQVIGQELAGDFVEATNRVKRLQDEGKDDRLDKEFKNDREELDAKLQETKNRTATAKAEADEIIGKHNKEKRQHEQAEAEAIAGISEAETRQMQAEIDKEQLRQKLEALKNGEFKGQETDERSKLLAEKEKLEAELKTVEEKIEALIGKNGEREDVKRQTLRAEHYDLTNRISDLAAKIAKLDSDQ